MPFIWTDINSPFIVHSCISSNCAGHVIHFGEASAEKRDPGEYERYSRKMWQQEGCMKRLCWVPFRTNQLHNTQNCDNYVRRPHITEALRRLWLDNKYSSPASVEKFAQRLLKLTRKEEAGDCCSEVAQSYSPPPAGQWPRTLHPESLFHVEDWRGSLIHQKASFLSHLINLCSDKLYGQSDDEDKEQMKKWESRKPKKHVSAFLLPTSAQWVLISMILNGKDWIKKTSNNQEAKRKRLKMSQSRKRQKLWRDKKKGRQVNFLGRPLIKNHGGEFNWLEYKVTNTCLIFVPTFNNSESIPYF